MGQYKTIFYASFVIFILVVLVLLWQNYLLIKENRDFQIDSEIDIINAELKYLKLDIRKNLGYYGKSVLALSKLSSLNEINFNNGINLNLENDFIAYMQGSEVFYQLRYLNKAGQEKIRIDRVGSEYIVYNLSELQNKSSRYYFTNAIKLERNEIYVSKLDLNVERGELENIGTINNPEYVPVIRFSSPVFDKSGVSTGVVVLNVYADYMLDELHNFIFGEEVFLVNDDGYYLYNINKENEFGFMLDNNKIFFNDYELGEDFFVVNEGKYKVNVDGKIFLLNFIYPDLEIYESYVGSKRVFGDGSERFWVLVHVIE